jgi:hypothetical protein
MNYLKHFIISLIVMSVTIGSFNWFVDPYGLYWSPIVTGVNNKKIKSSERGRLTKDYRVLQVAPEILIVGNSRVEMGFDDKSRFFEGHQVYNYASPGIGLETQFNRAFTQIKQNPNLHTIYLSLDFLDFLHSRRKIKPSKLSVIDSDFKVLSFLMSLMTLTDSVSTLVGQKRQANHINRRGTHIPEDFISITQHEGLTALFRQKLNEIYTRLNRKQLFLIMEDGSSAGIRQLEEVIEQTRKHKIELKLFINPYHYSYLHVLQDSGYFEEYIHWKKLLAQLAGKQSISIIDFSGFNALTSEQVNLAENHNQMAWFWEPAHYKAELGERMLSELNNGNVNPQFGRILSPDNITAIIAEDYLGLDEYQLQWQHLKSGINLD